MLTLVSNTTIGQFQYNGIVEFSADSSWDTLTDTATLTFPRRVEWNGKALATGADPLIKRGDQVTVELGYNEGTEVVFRAVVFRGYVKSIHASIPVTVECEDAAFLLKQKSITKSYKDVQISELLKDVLPVVVPFESPQLRLGPFRISNATAAMVLDKIKDQYFLKGWFRNGTFYFGFAYRPELQSRHRIRFDHDVVEQDLKYVKEEDVRIFLKVIVVERDNSRKEYMFGEPSGEQRTVYYYDKSAADVKIMGEQEIERLSYTGYRGSMTIFGSPYVQHGDVVDVTDPFYPERDGSYLVKSVKTTFGDGGYRQVLVLDVKV